MNGAGDNTSLGFVRLGFDPAGYGWIIAGNGSNQLRIAKFRGRGLNPIDNVNTFSLVNLTVNGGTIADFQNGDLAFDGQGTLFALANVTGGAASIYTLNSTVTPTTLTKKWTVVDGNTNNNFTGSVNGVAFSSTGSIHISTSTGIYFIDATTANSATGTVAAFPISTITGLTDLASASLPAGGPLPVRLLDFSGSLRNNTVTLRWQSEAETNFDRFEVERSTNNARFDRVATQSARGNGTGRAVNYEATDDLSGETAQAYFYRLKMIDSDGTFRYSKTIMIRKDRNGLKGFSLSPNPVVNGNAVLRFDAMAPAQVDIRIVDMTGKLVLQQRSTVVAGTNSILINNLQQIQPGNYILQTVYEGELQSLRFSVNR
ncbi:MAG: T9SS type A sorting domain-containing protein [Lacibacter sp.]